MLFLKQDGGIFLGQLKQNPNITFFHPITKPSFLGYIFGDGHRFRLKNQTLQHFSVS